MANGKQPEKQATQTILRLPQILDILAKNPDGLPMKSIVEALGNPPRSSIFVLLQQLVNNRYLEYLEGNKHYKIGPALIKLSAMIMDKHTIQKQFRSKLEEISKLTGEDAVLGILDGERVRYLDKVEGSESIRINIRIGSSAFLHSTSIGKLFLAYMDEEKRKQIFEKIELRPITDTTITDINQLYDELEDIRKKGFAISKEESIQGVFGFAAPIMNSNNEMIAGVVVTPPQSRAIENKQFYIRTIMETVKEFNHQLNV